MARISRTQLAAEHERIAHLVGLHPEGLNRVALAEAYRTAHGRTIEPRTLRRRLQELVEGGRLAVEGPGNAPIYRAATGDE